MLCWTQGPDSMKNGGRCLRVPCTERQESDVHGVDEEIHHFGCDADGCDGIRDGVADAWHGPQEARCHECVYLFEHAGRGRWVAAPRVQGDGDFDDAP